MINEVQIRQIAEVQAAGNTPQNVHTGNGDIYSNVGSLTVNNIVTYTYPQTYFPDEINFNYYKLFVIEKQGFNGSLVIAKNRALKESITDEVYARFGKFGKTEQEEIMKLPTLIATRNRHGRSTDEDHYMMYGFVKKFSIQDDLLMVEYSMNYQLSQQQINQIEDALQLEYAPDTNELDRVHYTIKEVNLRKVIGI